MHRTALAASAIRGAARFVMIVVASATVVLGVQLLRFDVMLDRAAWASSILNTAPNGGAVVWTAAEKELSPWMSRLGFSLVARAHWLDIQAAKSPLNLDELEKAEIALIAASPTLPASWQALAELRLARGNLSGGLAALRMSRLTGGHEGYLMVERAVLGLSHWRELTAEDRQQVAREIAATAEMGGPAQRFKDIFVAGDTTLRDGVRDELTRLGMARGELSRLGL